MHLVKLYKTTYHIPQNWDEVKYKTLHNLILLIFTGQTNEAFHFAMLCEYIPKRILQTLPEEYLQSLTSLLVWTKTVQYFSQLKVPRARGIFRPRPESGEVSPPPNNGEKITILELAWCHFHLKFLRDPAKIENALNEICFTLSRKKGTEYNDERKEANQKKYAKTVSEQHKLIVAQWFAGWYTLKIANRYFPSQEGDVSAEGETGGGADYGYFPLIYNLAKSGIYGTYEQVCKIPADTVFFNLMIEKSQSDS